MLHLLIAADVLVVHIWWKDLRETYRVGQSSTQRWNLWCKYLWLASVNSCETLFE